MLPATAPRPIARSTSVGTRRRVCEKLVLDDPEALLSKTPEEITAVTQLLQKGAKMLKYCRKSKPKERMIRVTPEGDGITWDSGKRSGNTVMFSDIIRIQRGRHTATFSRSKAGTAVTAGVSAGAGTGRPLEPTEEDDKAFSIICEANTPEDRTSLDLVANSPEECDAWVSGLQLLMFSQRVGLYDGDLKLLCRAFDKAPKHKSGQLTYDQVKMSLRSLNISVTKATLRPIFNTVCTVVDGTQVCDLEGVIQIVERIRDRPDVRTLFRKLLVYQNTQDLRALRQVVTSGVEATGLVVEEGKPDHYPSSLADIDEGDGDEDSGEQSPPLPHTDTGAEDGVAPGEEYSVGLTADTLLFFMHKYQGETDATQLDAYNIMRYFQQESPQPNTLPLLSLAGFTAYLTSTANSVFAPERAERYQDMTRPLTDYYIFSSHNTYLEGDQLSSNSSVNMYINALTSGCRCVELDCWDGADGEPIIYHGHTLTSRILFLDVIRAVREFGFKSSPFPVILSLEVHCSPTQQDRMAAILRTELGELLLLPPLPNTRSLTTPLPSPADLQYRVIVKGKTVQSKYYGRVKDQLGNTAMSSPLLPMRSLGAPPVSPPLPPLPDPADRTPVKPVDPSALSSATPASAQCFPKARRGSVDLSASAAGAAVGTVDLVEVALPALPPLPPPDGALFLFPFCHGCVEPLFMQARFRQNGRCGYVLKPTLSLGKLEKHLKWGSYKKPTGIPKPPKPVAPVAPTVLDSKLPVTVQSGRLGSLDTMSSLILVSAASAPEHAPSLLSVFPDLSLDQPPPLQDFPTVPEGLATPSNTVVLSSGAPGVSSPVVPPAPAALMGDGLGTPLDSSAPQDDDGVDEYSDGDDGDTVTTVTTTATGSVFGSNSVASSSITSGVADHMSIGPEVTFDMPGGGAGKGVRVFWGAEASAGDSSKLAELQAKKRHVSTSMEGVSARAVLAHIRSPLIRMDWPETELLVTLMGGQNLPTLEGEVVSPYCIATVHGHPIDKTRMRSQTIINNGLNPVWMHRFEFVIQHPNIAMLHIGVYHQVDIGRDVQIAHFAAPIDVLRQGYRSCSLRGKSGKRIPFCNLLCFFTSRPFG